MFDCQCMFNWTRTKEHCVNLNENKPEATNVRGQNIGKLYVPPRVLHVFMCTFIKSVRLLCIRDLRLRSHATFAIVTRLQWIPLYNRHISYFVMKSQLLSNMWTNLSSKTTCVNTENKCCKYTNLMNNRLHPTFSMRCFSWNFRRSIQSLSMPRRLKSFNVLEYWHYTSWMHEQDMKDMYF